MKPPLQDRRTQQIASVDGWQPAGPGATQCPWACTVLCTQQGGAFKGPQLEELQGQERGNGFLFQQHDLLKLYAHRIWQPLVPDKHTIILRV